MIFDVFSMDTIVVVDFVNLSHCANTLKGWSNRLYSCFLWTFCYGMAKWFTFARTKKWTGEIKTPAGANQTGMIKLYMCKIHRNRQLLDIHVYIWMSKQTFRHIRIITSRYRDYIDKLVLSNLILRRTFASPQLWIHSCMNTGLTLWECQSGTLGKMFI